MHEAEGNAFADRNVFKEFLAISEEKKLNAVHVYAVPENVRAINLYATLGFRELRIADEPRKEDTHLIYKLEEV